MKWRSHCCTSSKLEESYHYVVSAVIADNSKSQEGDRVPSELRSLRLILLQILPSKVKGSGVRETIASSCLQQNRENTFIILATGNSPGVLGNPTCRDAVQAKSATGVQEGTRQH